MGKRYHYFRGIWLGFMLLLLAAVNLQAQDVIIKNDKSEIQAKVLEITDVAIKYKQFKFQDGPVYNVNKADVFMILYQNGNRETFGQETVQKPVVADKPIIIATPEPAIAPVNKKDRPFIKNKSRIMLGFGGYKLQGETEKAPKAGFEKIRDSNGLISGFGIASNNFVDMFWIRYIGFTENGSPDGSGNSSVETVYGSKHYLSGYAFKEFDTKFISAGVLAGPALNYTRGSYSIDVFDYSSKSYTHPYSDVEASFFTVGLHTGLYLHKYLSTNKKGEKNFFMRLSFEQFVMAKGSYGSVLGLSFGL